MNEELLKLYAQLAEQREQLVMQLDKTTDANTTLGATVMYGGPVALQRLRREILWKEQQIIALLGGIIRYEMS